MMEYCKTLNISGCKVSREAKIRKKIQSKFDDFKRLKYWHSLILAVSQLNVN